MPTFSEKFQTILCEKILFSGCRLSSITSSSVSQHIKELKRLVRVGMFSKCECSLKNTLIISCTKIQGGHAPSADAHGYFQCVILLRLRPKQSQCYWGSFSTVSSIDWWFASDQQQGLWQKSFQGSQQKKQHWKSLK